MLAIVIVSAAAAYGSRFEAQNVLRTRVSPPGVGSVERSPDQPTYLSQSIVTLTAVSAEYPFIGWSGDTSATGNPMTLAIDRDRDVVANFLAYRLSAASEPRIGGSVESSPGRLWHAPGSAVRLTATPERGWAFAGWTGDVSATGASIQIIARRNLDMVAHFTLDTSTPEVSSLGARGGYGQIELRWTLRSPELASGVLVQRARAENGPWTTSSLPSRMEQGTTIAVDRTVEPGGTYFYRLRVERLDGSEIFYGPVAARTEELVTASAITRISPNPASEHAQVVFAMVRAGRVRFSITDVSGREVAVLADTEYPAGHHALTLNRERVRLLPGVYFIRFEAPDRSTVRRFVRIP